MLTAQQALERLKRGNHEFASSIQSCGVPISRSRWAELIGGQNPFAIILGCSDSRVPAEIVFNQGFGDLFVIRVAGNIASPTQIGSAEYAARLRSPKRGWRTPLGYGKHLSVFADVFVKTAIQPVLLRNSDRQTSCKTNL